MPSRRDLLLGVGGLMAATAGCVGDDGPTARCSSYSEGRGQHLRRVGPISRNEQVSLGVLVSTRATQSDEFDAVLVRDRDGDLVASVPLDENRDMSGLDPDDFGRFSAATGELYAVPLGPRPQHAVLTVSVVGPNGDRLDTIEHRFNCYDPDGSLP